MGGHSPTLCLTQSHHRPSFWILPTTWHHHGRPRDGAFARTSSRNRTRFYVCSCVVRAPESPKECVPLASAPIGKPLAEHYAKHRQVSTYGLQPFFQEPGGSQKKGPLGWRMVILELKNGSTTRSGMSGPPCRHTGSSIPFPAHGWRTLLPPGWSPKVNLHGWKTSAPASSRILPSDWLS